MAEAARAEKRSRNRATRIQPLEVRLSFQDSTGVQQVVPAHVVDVSEEGAGLQLHAPLPVGEVVSIIGSASAEIRLKPKARVCWSRPLASGLYRAGLQFETPSGGESSVSDDTDLYDILQCSAKASTETIHRVYRMLAQQYHPDNQETGDEAMFRRLVAAYNILSDPERRAAYDLQRGGVQRSRWRVFHSPEAARGAGAERLKRLGVLQLLYNKRVREPRDPGVSIFDLEDLLAIPRDHLEFTLWYLKERGLLTRSDNNRFQITVAGVEATEELEEKMGGAGANRLLPAAPDPMDRRE